MECTCDKDAIGPDGVGKICKEHFAWLERHVLYAREQCAELAEKMAEVQPGVTAYLGLEIAAAIRKQNET